jgi:hypothetical protein
VVKSLGDASPWYCLARWSMLIGPVADVISRLTPDS